MILKADIEFHAGSGIVFKMGMEQVIDGEEEAQAFGEESNKLVSAFMDGYGADND